ncbi:MAG: hypothetical protein U0350_49115 [Caldilineaceae bacterium]
MRRGRVRMMATTLDQTTISPPLVSEADAQRAASTYVAAVIDPALAVVSGTRFYHKSLAREVWQFIIRCPQGPVDAIAVDSKTGMVIPRTDEEIQLVREKAALVIARQQGAIPRTAQGYVLGEYARRQARTYLDTQLSMFYDAAHPLFIPGERPLWQVTIVFHMYDIGPFTLGVLDVDATTGTPLPLSLKQLKRIRERTCAIIGHSTPTPTPS